MSPLAGESGMSGMSGQVGSVTVRALPLGLDLSLLADGALPAALLGPAWAIATAKALATPGLGAELTTNGGMEGTYTAGVAASWTKTGALAVATESADAHGGSKAQEFYGAAAANYIQQSYSALADTWYRFGGWAKRTLGTAGNTVQYLYGADFNVYTAAIDSAAYAERVITRFNPGAQTIRPRVAYQNAAGTGDTVITDDASLKAITAVDCFAFGRLPFASPNVHVRVKLTQAFPTAAGVALCWDSPTNPQSGLLLVADKATLRLLEFVSGVYTQTLISIGYTYSAGDYIGLSMDGGSVKAWSGPYTAYYQRGTTQTVAHAEIVSNVYHGIFSSDPTALVSGVGFAAGAEACASGTSTTPKVMLIFDDLYESHYTEAFAYLASKGLTGTAVGLSSNVGGAGFLTLPNMQAMYAGGWDFGLHIALSGLSQSAQEAAIATDRNYLENNGMPRAARCSRMHSMDGSTPAAMLAQGMVADIGTGAPVLTYNPVGYVVPGFTQETVYGHTVADLLTHVATAIVTNKVHFMMPFHRITTDTGLDISPAKFHDIIDGLIAAGYSFMTLSEYVGGMRY